MEKEFERSGSRPVWLALLYLMTVVFGGPSALADQSAAVGWDPSPDTNVVGYNVYYGTGSGNYTNMLVAGDSTTLLVAGLVEGATYYFAATAYDITGVESDLSNEVSYSVPGGSTNSATFPPTISTIGNQTIPKNSSLAPVSFTIGDPDSAADTLTLAGYSSYPALVPAANITFGGSGSNRTVQVTPAANASGLVAIGIIVTDEFGNTVITQFSLTVLAGGGSPGASPVLSGLSALTLVENSAGTNVPFVVTDSDTPAASLVVSVGANNPVLFANLAVNGSGNNRTLQLTPAVGQTGLSQVSVVAADNTGHSTTNTFTVTVVVNPLSRTLTLLTNGNGTISPNLAASALTVGKVYTVTAKPSVGNLFAGWSGDLVSASPKLTFTLVSNMVLQASFIPDPVYLSGGNYSGLFAESSGVQVASAGYFTASLARSGSYSGKVKLGGGNYSISGKINFQCQATNLIKRGTNILTLVFQADQAGHLYGQLAQDSWIAPLEANRAAVYSKTNLASQAGQYTLVLPGLPGSTVLPEGSGYATVKVSPNGVTTLAGTLADGSKISQGFAISEAGLWPVYFSLDAGKGLLLSWQAFRAGADSDFDGWMAWIKPTNSAARFYPGGFDFERSLSGQAYVPPSGTNTVLNYTSYIQLAFGGGNLSENFADAIALGASSRVSNLSSNKLMVKFTPATGLFAGSVTDPVANKSWNFGGAILQKDNIGYGFLAGTNLNSVVVLYPH